jgi:DNA-binding transcriptional ArsR family regulator
MGEQQSASDKGPTPYAGMTLYESCDCGAISCNWNGYCNTYRLIALSAKHLRIFSSLESWSLYTLTSICAMEYIKSVESVFEIIAEPNRRAILSLLVTSQQSVGEIERQLHMPQPTVSKHLRVLREAGFVESTVDAQRRLYRLKPGPLQEIDAWLAPFRRFWSAHVDALERHLDRMHQSKVDQSIVDQSTPTKTKTRRKTPRSKPRT